MNVCYMDHRIELSRMRKEDIETKCKALEIDTFGLSSEEMRAAILEKDFQNH